MTRTFPALAAVLAFVSLTPPVGAQLFKNLEAFGSRTNVGDPEVDSQWFRREGPKGLASGDLDGDGLPDLAVSNLDGTVSVLMNRGGEFEDAMHLRTGTQTLRDIQLADFTGDGALDIVTASIVDGVLVIFANDGTGGFGPPTTVETWKFGRDLAVGDFDGDGTADLAVGGCSVGVRQLKGNGDGSFELVQEFDEFASGEGSKPVYSFATVRRPGRSKDDLFVTHARSNRVCSLVPDDAGVLRVSVCSTVNYNPYDLDIGALTDSIDSERLDVVTTHRNEGFIQIRRGLDGQLGFDDQVHQEIRIPGGPRSVEIVDLNGDGWNDLAVVLRNLDRVVTLENKDGFFELASEMPVGESPRELVVEDFDVDGVLDVAVINRRSADTSVLLGKAGDAGFSTLDQLYLVDGEVRALGIEDYDDDGFQDVIQLHGASGDFSVRFGSASGDLSEPTHYTIGELPADVVTRDVNADGRKDIVAANLGREQGSVSVRLGLPDGSFAEEERIPLPFGVSAHLFAVEVADFDGDGILDLVAGYADCRVSFYRGLGGGEFVVAGDHDHVFYTFGWEIRSMVAADFDQDGDIDLAGASMKGNLVVAENTGDLLTTSQLVLRNFPLPLGEDFFSETTDLIPVHYDDDGDLDLVFGTSTGAWVMHGSHGVNFEVGGHALPGTQGVPASQIAEADFDGDGEKDLAVSCKLLSCIFILVKDGAGRYVPALTVDVPSGDYLAAGDIDGDGHADLIGSGKVLWTALSSRPPVPGESPVFEGERHTLDGVVINEIMAINNLLPLELAGGRKSDWIELHNGGAEEAELTGTFITVDTLDGERREYTIPEGTKIPAGGHLVLVASRREGPFHMGFKLPGAGATVTLFDASGIPTDRVTYPEQRQNVSFGRFNDGTEAFVFDIYPSPGEANKDNGPLPPLTSVLSAGPVEHVLLDTPEAVRANEPIRFFAAADDDEVVLSLSVMYRRLDVPELEFHRVLLFDDGFHEDGSMQDGLFSGVLDRGLPRGASIEFYLEALDLSGVTSQMPTDDVFYTLAVDDGAPSGLEISEFVARNTVGLVDEEGGTSDWVEIRNCGAAPVSLGGYFLADEYPATEFRYEFPANEDLQPGEYLIIFTDGKPNQGPLHAPFRIDADGGRVVLGTRSATGGAVVVDGVSYTRQPADGAYARAGCGGEFQTVAPTPNEPNSDEPAAPRGDVDRSFDLQINDAIGILGSLFLDMAIRCPGAADVNSDAEVNITDAVALLDYLFRGGPPPREGVVSCEGQDA